MKRLTELHKRRIGESVSTTRRGTPLTDEHKKALRGSHTNREKVECEHCNREFAVNVIKRHKKKCEKIMAERE